MRTCRDCCWPRGRRHRDPLASEIGVLTAPIAGVTATRVTYRKPRQVEQGLDGRSDQ